MRSPLALVAIAFAAGIAAAVTWPQPWSAWALALAAALAVLLLGLRRRALGVPLLAAGFALGALAAAGAAPLASRALAGAAPWSVSGRVAHVETAATGTRVTVDLATVARGEHERDAGAHRVAITLPGAPLEPLLPGDTVRARTRLRVPHGFHEPDTPDPDLRWAERGVVLLGGVTAPAGLARMDGAVGPAPVVALRRAAAALQSVLRARVEAHLDGEPRALVASLVLGDRFALDADLEDAFRRSGTSHVLSVSGLHLAVAGLIAFAGLRRLLLRITPLARRVAARRIAAVAALPLVALYTLMTGAAVATVRSFVGASLVLLGVALGRPATVERAISLSALGLLGSSPLLLFDPSFQLSFSAVIGMVALAAPIVRRLIAGRLDGEGHAPRLARAALRLTIASAAAIVTTAPICAWHFAQVSPIGLLANLVIVPLAELWVLPVGLLGCMATPIDAVAGPLLRLAGAGARALAWLARFFAAHGLDGHVAPLTTVETIAWYGALLLVAMALRSGRAAAWRGAFALAIVLAVALGWRTVRPRLDPALTVTFLDVGQGDATLVELPDGRRLLVDGGGSFDPAFDPGARVLVPWLHRHGVTQLDVVVLTHPHPDHAGGLASVVAAFPVGEVWYAGGPSRLPAVERLRAAADARGLDLVPPRALAGPARVEVLHPLIGHEVRVPAGYSENDGSIVLRVVYGSRAVLLTGDIERRAEDRLAASDATLRADVLKGPHHCSRTSSTATLLAKVQPRFVVCPVGEGNPWGFPSTEVVARIESAGARVLRTDRDGAVTVRVRPSGAIDVTTVR